MFKKILPLIILSFFLITPVLAQEATATLISEPTVEASNYELEGIEVDQITVAPSALGLWWRGVKENVSLAFTFDAVKKAEKSLKYAEERMQIAEKFSDLGENVKNQEKVQANIAKAQKFMEKVELKKEKWLEDKDPEKVSNLIKNIASHQIRKGVIFNRLEEKIENEEVSEKVLDLRDKGIKESQKLMNAINNVNIPTVVREHLEDVKAKIDSQSLEIKNYQQAKDELKAKIKQGVEGIQEDLNSLNTQRKEQIKMHIEDARILIPSMNRIMRDNDLVKPIKEQEGNMIQNRINDVDQGNTESQKIKLQERNSNQINNNRIEKQCLNFPGPDFCPSGIEDVIVVGYDENNCAIYDCQSNSSNELNSSPGQKVKNEVKAYQQGE